MFTYIIKNFESIPALEPTILVCRIAQPAQSLADPNPTGPTLRTFIEIIEFVMSRVHIGAYKQI